jgi:hypothetical protein
LTTVPDSDLRSENSGVTWTNGGKIYKFF